MFVFICHRAVLSVWSVSQLDDRDFLPHGHARESRGQPHSGHCKEDVYNILFNARPEWTESPAWWTDLSSATVWWMTGSSHLCALLSLSLLPVLSSYVPPLHVNAAELPVVSPIHVMSVVTSVTCVQGPISRTEGLRAEGWWSCLSQLGLAWVTSHKSQSHIYKVTSNPSSESRVIVNVRQLFLKNDLFLQRLYRYPLHSYQVVSTPAIELMTWTSTEEAVNVQSEEIQPKSRWRPSLCSLQWKVSCLKTSVASSLIDFLEDHAGAGSVFLFDSRAFCINVWIIFDVCVSVENSAF